MHLMLLIGGKKGAVHIDLPKDVLVDTLREPKTMEEEIMLEHEAQSNISSVSTTSKNNATSPFTFSTIPRRDYQQC